MAITVQEAQVLFSADGLNQVRTQAGVAGQALDRTTRKASMLDRALGSVSRGFAGMVSAAAAGAALYAVTKRIEKLADVADKAAVTGLSGQFLQRLDYAATQTGVSVEKVSTAIEKMTINIGAGGDAFAKIGLNLDELRAMTPEQQFAKIADHISKLPTAAERANAAVKVFGRGAVDMTNMFSGGMKNVNALMKEAEAIGVGLSDEALAKAAAADDSIQRMYASFGGLFDQITVGLAPVFDDISTTITGWIPPISEFVEKFSALEEKGQFISDLIDASMTLAMEKIKSGWDDMLAGMLKSTFDAAVKINNILSPEAILKQGILGMFRPGIGQQAQQMQAKGVDEAQAKLDAVLARFDAGGNLPAWQGPKEQAAGAASAGLAGLFGGLLDKAKDSPLLTQAKFGGKGILDRAMLDLNWLKGAAKNAFTGDVADKEKAAAKDKQMDEQQAAVTKTLSAEALFGSLREGAMNKQLGVMEDQLTIQQGMLAAQQAANALLGNIPAAFGLI